MKLLTKAVSAPVRKPASGPKATAVMIMMAEQGLKLGSGMISNTVRPTTAMAAITAIGTSSRAWGFFLSNTKRKGMAEASRNSRPSRISELRIT